MSLAENLHCDKSVSIAFDRSNANMGCAQTLIQTERANTQENLECLLFFSVSDVFANAKVMLCYA